jgi:hypothetical protein
VRVVGGILHDLARHRRCDVPRQLETEVAMARIAHSLVVLALVALAASPALAQVAPAPQQQVVVTPAGYGTMPAPYTSSYSGYGTRGRAGRVVVGMRHEQQPDRGLWGGGLGLFLAGWVLDIISVPIANSFHPRDNWTDSLAWGVLPFAGPVGQLTVGAPHPALPITFGLMEIVGAVMFIVGLTSTHDAEVPVYAFGDPSNPETPRLAFNVTPSDGGGYASATLTF